MRAFSFFESVKKIYNDFLSFLLPTLDSAEGRDTRGWDLSTGILVSVWQGLLWEASNRHGSNQNWGEIWIEHPLWGQQLGWIYWSYIPWPLNMDSLIALIRRLLIRRSLLKCVWRLFGLHSAGAHAVMILLVVRIPDAFGLTLWNMRSRSGPTLSPDKALCAADWQEWLSWNVSWGGWTPCSYSC